MIIKKVFLWLLYGVLSVLLVIAIELYPHILMIVGNGLFILFGIIKVIKKKKNKRKQ